MRQTLFSSFVIPLCLSLFFFLIATSTSHDTTFNDNLIHETCKKCAQSDPKISYKFCVASLQAAPTSHCVDNLRQLGHISIKLLGRNLTNSRSYIKEVSKNNEMDTFMRSRLHDCYDLYSDAIPTTKQALKDYKAKRYDDVNIDVSSIMDASTTCEDGFKEKEDVVSPLAKINYYTFQLSAISLSIINMISSNVD